jgi:hypothetical protein
VPVRRIGHRDDVAGTAIYLSWRAGRHPTDVPNPVDRVIAWLA